MLNHILFHSNAGEICLANIIICINVFLSFFYFVYFNIICFSFYYSEYSQVSGTIIALVVTCNFGTMVGKCRWLLKFLTIVILLFIIESLINIIIHPQSSLSHQIAISGSKSSIIAHHHHQHYYNHCLLLLLFFSIFLYFFSNN